jgi:diacylglycerol O-acyltransferase-1
VRCMLVQSLHLSFPFMHVSAHLEAAFLRTPLFPGIPLTVVIVALKVASYALTNRDLRDMYLESIPTPEEYKSAPYPENIKLSNLLYFWWAPTLIYQPVYPRTDRFRWSFFLKRSGEAIGILIALWFIIAQYATSDYPSPSPILFSLTSQSTRFEPVCVDHAYCRPILNNSITPIKEFHLAKIIERVLKLSTVSLVAWLAGFFCIFHSTLNALAEIMHFADRKFYDAWWNSGSMGAYWRLWNIPVHGYFKRHIYVPLRRRGWSSRMASTVVFVISAVIHELLLGVPTHAVPSPFEILLFNLRFSNEANGS